MKGQISAEMLIILAIVVAIALLVASQLVSMTKKTGEQVESAHNTTMEGLKNVTENVTFP